MYGRLHIVRPTFNKRTRDFFQIIVRYINVQLLLLLTVKSRTRDFQKKWYIRNSAGTANANCTASICYEFGMKIC